MEQLTPLSHSGVVQQVVVERPPLQVMAGGHMWLSEQGAGVQGIVGVKQQLEELESQASNNGAMPEHTRR